MKIADKDFILTSISDTSLFFDLELLINLKNPKQKKKEKILKQLHMACLLMLHCNALQVIEQQKELM